MNLLFTIKSLIECMPSPRIFEGVNTPISESRIINLHLPRRSGKSTIIKALSREYSSIVLLPSYICNSTLGYLPNEAFVDLESILRVIRGKSSNGLKYRYILIDEYTNICLSTLVNVLESYNLLERDYRIVQLGTPLK